jgi:hypothetical protein
MYKKLVLAALMGLTSGSVLSAPAPVNLKPDTVSHSSVQGYWKGTTYLAFRTEDEPEIVCPIEVVIIDSRIIATRERSSPLTLNISVIQDSNLYVYDNWENYTPTIDSDETNFVLQVIKYDYNRGVLHIRKTCVKESLIEKWELVRQ